MIDRKNKDNNIEVLFVIFHIYTLYSFGILSYFIPPTESYAKEELDNNRIDKNQISIIDFYKTIHIEQFYGFNEQSQLGSYNFISLTPFIKLNHNYLSNDPLNVYIISDQSDQTEGFVNDVVRAIYKWSEMLKVHSDNHLAWDFNIQSIIKPISTNDFIKINFNADIVIELVKDNNTPCGILGFASRPNDDLAKPIEAQLTTTCLFENNIVLAGHRVLYSTAMHELGHVLGLGHAYNKDGDLMCGEGYDHSNSLNSCKYSTLAEPSELNLNAIVSMYGYDGFEFPNITLEPNSYYQPNSK